MDEPLLRETHNKVRILTMNRPESRNALTNDLTQRLARELRAAEQDSRVAVVILTGTDPAFCSGLDFSELTKGTYDLSLLVDPMRSPWKVLWSMNTPVIGAVNGAAVTGGLVMALMCSFLIASDQATFGETYGKILGWHPMAGLTSLLPGAVGLRRAREMSFTGRYMGAREAYERGFVNHVVPHDQLLDFSREVAAEIVNNDQGMVALLNDLYRRAISKTVAEGLALEEKGYRERGMDLETVLQRYRNKVWSAPLRTSRR